MRACGSQGSERLLSSVGARSHLRRYGSELVVAEQVEFPAVGVAAEVQSFVPIDGEAKDAQEEHPDRSKEQGVELADHRRRPELERMRTHRERRKNAAGG